jgi:nuclease-like protein/zinc ribbon protein
MGKFLKNISYKMIIKQPDKITSGDKFSKAGYNAEKQMAFYLQRAFANEEMIAVLNGIRIKSDDGDVCQIDHLIIHQYGMVIIESKSVSSKVKINDDGSWERVWNNHYEGMPSPVLQAERQADFLRAYLNKHKNRLMKQVLGHQHSFDKTHIEILVAISDKGRIERSNHSETEFVFKADQIAGKIKEIYSEKKTPDFIFSMWSFQRIIDFLIKKHTPVQQEEKEISKPSKSPEKHQEVPQISEEPAVYDVKMQTSTCPECSQRMEIKWGKYNYYWKCTVCENNVSTQEKCPHCKNKLKIRKRKTKYFLYCEKCDIEGLYHEEGM